jgi:putative N6-adenine-specific DNA methylase
MDFTVQSDLFLTVAKGLSPYLQSELNDLGFKDFNSNNISVQLKGSMDDAIKMNLSLRTATNVLYTIKKFRAYNLDDLDKNLRTIEWDEFVDVDSYFSINSFTDNPAIKTNLFLNQKSKDAVVDFFQAKYGKRPDSGPERTKVCFFIFWQFNEAIVYVDTSGINLTKHGYRKIPVRAPLQENLASALVMATKWDGQSHFINPMCGSGTLVIEAALIATNRMNCLLRDNYSFMHVPGFDKKIYEELRMDLKKNILKTIAAKIIATDNDAKAIEAAKRNAETAGVNHLIDFRCCDFRETEIPEGNGIVIFNPPYGERIGEEQDLFPLYKELGDFLKNKCAGKRGFIFSGNLDLIKNIGLRPKRKMDFFNARIPCKLLEFELYEGSKKRIENS